MQTHQIIKWTHLCETLTHAKIMYGLSISIVVRFYWGMVCSCCVGLIILRLLMQARCCDAILVEKSFNIMQSKVHRKWVMSTSQSFQIRHKIDQGSAVITTKQKYQQRLKTMQPKPVTCITCGWWIKEVTGTSSQQDLSAFVFDT